MNKIYLGLLVCISLLNPIFAQDNQQNLLNPKDRELIIQELKAYLRFIVEKKTSNLQIEIDSLKLNINQLKTLDNRFLNDLDRMEIYHSDLKSMYNELSIEHENLKYQATSNINRLQLANHEIENITSTLSIGLSDANKNFSELKKLSGMNSESIDSVNSSLIENQRQTTITFFGVLVLVLLFYLLINYKQNKASKVLLKKHNIIFEQQIIDNQKLADWLSIQISSGSFNQNNNIETDHLLAIRVADEIIRMSTNLSRMDSNIKGFKQLSASVKKLEQSLNSNGYEIENFVGKQYDSGMNIQANFVFDENLISGERIITRIIKPQINFHGKLIQVAQVEVSQGE